MFNQQLYYFFVDKTYAYFWQDTFISYFLSFINFYIIYFSLPYLIRNKNKLVSIMISLVAMTIITAMRYYVSKYFWMDIIHLPAKEMMTEREFFYTCARLTFIISVYSLLIKFAIDWFETQKLRSEMINQTQASELALLRSQVNPHFLFNTLNNIYSLVYQKSDNAPAAVMKLSSIMRYVLYDANTEFVQLEKEVEYLQSFIELQKLRTHQPDFVEFTVTGVINGKTIAPMLLIPFVENAFKHGSRNAMHPGIVIRLDAEPERITFGVINSIKRSNNRTKDKIGGIGLQNIQRRLELLYKGRYKLVINDENDQFEINLVIDITKP